MSLSISLHGSIYVSASMLACYVLYIFIQFDTICMVPAEGNNKHKCSHILRNPISAVYNLQLASFWFLPVWDPGLSGPRLAHLLKSPSQMFCHLFRTRALAKNCKISLLPGGYTLCWFEMTQSWFGMCLQRLLMVPRWVSMISYCRRHTKQWSQKR